MSCNNNLLSQIACLRDHALSKVCAEAGNPFLRPIVLRTFSYALDNYTYEQISPVPFVKENPQGQEGEIGGVSNLRGDTILYQCNVSRQYTREQLDGQAIDFIIDGDIRDLQGGDRFSGILCELASIDDKVTYWELQLEERVSEQMFTLV